VAGQLVETRPVQTIDDLGGYDALVVGSAVLAGHWMAGPPRSSDDSARCWPTVVGDLHDDQGALLDLEGEAGDGAVVAQHPHLGVPEGLGHQADPQVQDVAVAELQDRRPSGLGSSEGSVGKDSVTGCGSGCVWWRMLTALLVVQVSDAPRGIQYQRLLPVRGTVICRVSAWVGARELTAVYVAFRLAPMPLG
jgi:hypothetical protein